MASDMKGLIQESLGPLPRICQEQILLDLERARMTAEDARADAARMARRTRTLRNEARGVAITALITGGMTRRDFRDALIETNDAIGDAIRETNQIINQQTDDDEEMSDNDEEPDDTVMAAGSESEADDAPHCVICRQRWPWMYFMEPQGRWAGLAPGACIVCAMCYRDDMGVVESAFSRQPRPSP